MNGASEESAQRRNYYLDLAGIENYTNSETHELVSSNRPSCGIAGAEKGTKSQKPAKSKSKMTSSAVKNFEHCNSARTDAHGTNTICEENETVTSNVFVAARQQSSHFGLSPLNPKFPATANVSQSNPNDLETVSSSHYHRRHRHREKNQNRAMKQVAEWIEKEHIYHKSEKRVVVVQRHEHHHVHEHFHHHIHHCGHT